MGGKAVHERPGVVHVTDHGFVDLVAFKRRHLVLEVLFPHGDEDVGVDHVRTRNGLDRVRGVHNAAAVGFCVCFGSFNHVLGRFVAFRASVPDVDTQHGAG